MGYDIDKFIYIIFITIERRMIYRGYDIDKFIYIKISLMEVK